MEITVVGAGVIGLATALALEEAGHTVRIVASGTSPSITSDVAGAIWFPYRVGPPDRAALWAAQTRAWLETQAGDIDAGIDVLTGYEIGDEPADPPRPWWAAHIDVARAPAPVPGFPASWKFTAPRVEPAKFLPWITKRLRARIEIRTVTDLTTEPGDIVVNCTGLGARTLVGDTELVALYGQIALAAPGSVDLSVTITDNRDPRGIFYVIPRRDHLVLGGCSLPLDADSAPPPDDGITARILEQAAALNLRVGPVIRERTGLRPYRPSVRLERDGRIIHNYGHGGAGFTLSRGCADEVVRLAERR
ncbi:MAG TPA: FAD-dependent oxidoreductase [Kofleriaceae bacterium]